MDPDQRQEIVYRLPSGKPIFKDKNHPAHKFLTVGELQNVAFHFYDQIVQTQAQLQRYVVVESPSDFNRTKAQFQTYKEHYIHFNSLWRRALIAAKKTR